MKLIACAAAALLFAATPAGAQEPLAISEPSTAELAAASAIPARFMDRLAAGNAAGAVGDGFAGTMMEYETAGLQSVIDIFSTVTDYYGPVTGWELGAQQSYTSRLVRQSYLAFTENGPFVVSFDLYRRSAGWMLLRIDVKGEAYHVFGSPLGRTPTDEASPAD